LSQPYQSDFDKNITPAIYSDKQALNRF